jgi:hypothetical protein
MARLKQRIEIAPGLGLQSEGPGALRSGEE